MTGSATAETLHLGCRSLPGGLPRAAVLTDGLQHVDRSRGGTASPLDVISLPICILDAPRDRKSGLESQLWLLQEVAAQAMAVAPVNHLVPNHVILHRSIFTSLCQLPQSCYKNVNRLPRLLALLMKDMALVRDIFLRQ